MQFHCQKCKSRLEVVKLDDYKSNVLPCSYCQHMRSKNLREMAYQKEREDNTSQLSAGYISGLMHAAAICRDETCERVGRVTRTLITVLKKEI